jgi:signal transduction histidine kinase
MAGVERRVAVRPVTPMIGDPSSQNLGRRCLQVWRWSFALGAGFALLSALKDYTVSHKLESGLPLSYWLIGEAAVYAFWSFFAPLILWMMLRFPLTRKTWLRSGAVHLLFYLGLAVAYSVHYWAVDSLQLPMNAKPLSADFLKTFYVAFSGALIKYYAPIMVGGYIALYYARLREQELRTATLATELAQAELRALKMQLQPHFLFNTLHSISTLVHTNAKGADRMIAQLSDLLRATLNAGAVEYAPLRQELDFAEKYLAIEQTRFSDRLTITIDAAPDTLDVEVPYLILQPLVENAVRHGVSKNVGQGTIHIEARLNGAQLRVTISDNGPGIADSPSRLRGGGVGLDNTRARLAQAYPGKSQLRLARAGERGTIVELTLPVPSTNELPADEPQPFAVPQIPRLPQGV